MKGFIVYIPPRDPAFLLVSQAPDDKTLKAYWSEHFVLLLVFLEGSSINHKFQQVSTAKTNSNKSLRSFNKEPLTSSTSLYFELNQNREISRNIAVAFKKLRLITLYSFKGLLYN